MIAETILFSVAFAALLVGTYTDFRVREVPDWLNYSLLFIGVGLRLIFSLVFSDVSYIWEGALGFGIFFVIAVIMFYAGQWGGGDSKLVIGLGTLIGFQFAIDTFLLAFIINIVIFGALFGIIFSIYLTSVNFSKFRAEFRKRFAKLKIQKWLVWIGVVVMLAASAAVPPDFSAAVVVFAGLLLFSFYAFVYLKSVEASSMIMYVDPERLTEGDWVAEDVIVNGKKVCSSKDLGLTLSQIDALKRYKKKGKVDKVLVKYGMPFVPSFLIAFIVTIMWGNILFRILIL